MIAADILEALEAKHAGDIRVRELRLSSGAESPGRIDLWAISPSPGRGNIATSYEIKISRSDFRRDTPVKQRGARMISDYFYYAAPKGLIRPSELPEWAGLIEFTPNSLHPSWPPSMRTTVAAPKRDKDSPSWGLVCSILRRWPIIGEDGEKFVKLDEKLVRPPKASAEDVSQAIPLPPSAEDIVRRLDEIDMTNGFE